MKTIVKRSATSASGAIRGIATPSYHSRPFARIPTTRLMIPAASGMPRNISTLVAIAPKPIRTSCAAPSPSQTGKTARKR